MRMEDIWISYLNLTCAHAAVEPCNEIVSLFFCFRKTQKKNFNNSFVFFASTESESLRNCFSPEKRSIIKVYHCLTQIFAPFDSQKPRLPPEKKLFVQHKNVFYHCIKYLVIKREKFMPPECVWASSDDGKNPKVETKKKFVVTGHMNEASSNSSPARLDQEHHTHGEKQKQIRSV